MDETLTVRVANLEASNAALMLDNNRLQVLLLKSKYQTVRFRQMAVKSNKAAKLGRRNIMKVKKYITKLLECTHFTLPEVMKKLPAVPNTDKKSKGKGGKVKGKGKGTFDNNSDSGGAAPSGQSGHDHGDKKVVGMKDGPNDGDGGDAEEPDEESSDCMGTGGTSDDDSDQ
ncbi:unnamed protein product [Prorocentrum cordatum]|uniref:Uncharacterized protein n=1 Tax=Prorocentrum cordatum TaxID=2364126 RepID=A0ABN9PR09_9DINO|nr:unnamed protein product [Polarella glacialis]